MGHGFASGGSFLNKCFWKTKFILLLDPTISPSILRSLPPLRLLLPRRFSSGWPKIPGSQHCFRVENTSVSAEQSQTSQNRAQTGRPTKPHFGMTPKTTVERCRGTPVAASKGPSRPGSWFAVMELGGVSMAQRRGGWGRKHWQAFSQERHTSDQSD